MRVTKGLIVAKPWIGYILRGGKTWEMRSTRPSFRGWFALIKKGTCAVYGVARLTDVGRPLSPDEMVASFDKHLIPEHLIRNGAAAKWNTPWKLTGVRALETPVPSDHKRSAVTLANLSADVAAAIKRQLGYLPNGRVAADLRSRGDAPGPARALTVAGAAARGLVIGEVELTEGNLRPRNSHFYLRGFIEKFPADTVGGPNKAMKAAKEVTVDWGRPVPVQTDIDGAKKFFRARGWVRPFFEMNEAAPGDKVVIEQLAPYRYRVGIRKAGGRGK